MTQGHHHEPGCPYVPGEKGLCQMGLLHHIVGWQQAFQVLLPVELLLCIIACMILVFLYRFKPPLIIFSYLVRKRIDKLTYIQRMLQDIFAQGILNTKSH
ncbi:MAG: hypothetical protein RLY57_120 [Candidatus Parcubacteria bacterium]